MFCAAGDLPAEEGVVLVAAGAHRDPRLRRLFATYGRSRAGSDGTQSGWCADSAVDVTLEEVDDCNSDRRDSSLSTTAASIYGRTKTAINNPSQQATACAAQSELNWVTLPRFRAGDIVLLSLDCLHLTSKNVTSNYRLSGDTRWLPASHELDPRVK
jgi:hypothetical protein